MWESVWRDILVSGVGGLVAALAFAGVVYCWRRVQGREQANAIREVIVRNRRRILNPDEGGALVTTSGGPSSTTQ